MKCAQLQLSMSAFDPKRRFGHTPMATAPPKYHPWTINTKQQSHLVSALCEAPSGGSPSRKRGFGSTGFTPTMLDDHYKWVIAPRHARRIAGSAACTHANPSAIASFAR